MMKTALILALTLVPAVAGAGLCPNCADKMYIQSIGTCTDCGGMTSSGAFKLCRACSEKQNKCQACLAPLTPAPTPAAGAIPAALDLTGPSEQTNGRWKFVHEFTNAGTKDELSRGRLFYDGKEVPDPGINDCYQTPWGGLFWLGTPGTGRCGWMPVKVDPRAKGKMLAPPAEATPGAAAIAVGPEQDGKTIEAALGGKVVVRLEGNPTTGFTWVPGKGEGDAVRLTGEIAYKQNPAPEQMVGVGGQFTATFEAAKAGRSKIVLEYRRPWEKDVPPAKTFTLTVNVKGTPPAGRPVGLIVGADQDGKTVEVAAGSKLRIVLDGNPTTGFSWLPGQCKGDSVTVEKANYLPAKAGPGVVGAGGKFVSILRAVKPGQTTVVLEYKRPWEKNTPPAKTFTLTVVVKALAAN